jgi:sugar/nucleoside kinase (ribokinase family)
MAPESHYEEAHARILELVAMDAICPLDDADLIYPDAEDRDNGSAGSMERTRTQRLVDAARAGRDAAHADRDAARADFERADAARRRVAHLAATTARGSIARVPCAAHLHPGTAVVVGGMVLDVTASPGPHARLRRGSSTPGAVLQNPGGVGRNIAEGLARLVGDAGPAPLLISAVGDDIAGRVLIDAWRALGADTRGVRVCTGASTPVVATVLDHDGEVAASVADTLTAETGLDADWIAKHADAVGRATVLVLDGNCAESTIAAAVDSAERVVGPWANGEQKPLVWFEPVSVAKSIRATNVLAKLDFVSPNADECRAMANAVRARQGVAPLPMDSSVFEFRNIDDAVSTMCDDVGTLLRAGVRRVVLTLGSLGCVLVKSDGGYGSWRHVPALTDGAGRPPLRSLVGAGDALVAGAVAALMAGREEEAAMAVGVASARRAAEADGPVHSGHSLKSLERDAAGSAARVRTVRGEGARRESMTSGCG